MRDKKIILVFGSIAAVSFILMIAFQLISVNLFGFKGSVFRTETSVLIKKYVTIEVTNIPLNINTYNGEDIKINYVNETDLIIEETMHDILIKQDPDFSFSLFSKDQLNYRMDVSLPDRIYNSVSIITTSGEVNLDYLYTKELKINSRSGDIKVSDTGGRIDIQSDSADVDISFLELDDTVNINTISGNVTVLMPERKEPKLTFLSESGLFTGNFFRFDYKDYRGDLFMQMGEDPKAFHVVTKSGNLMFLKRILHEN
ncbi:MAG: DUF4097 domain-containing protein [Eubacterium sp.]|jgi:hypothetical protein|nr:DUF4097 domain-containing protein [Eubacterium sp.]